MIVPMLIILIGDIIKNLIAVGIVRSIYFINGTATERVIEMAKKRIYYISTKLWRIDCYLIIYCISFI